MSRINPTRRPSSKGVDTIKTEYTQTPTKSIMSNQINQTKDASPIIQDLTTLKYTYCICHYRICSKDYLIPHGKSNIANQRLFITTQKNYGSSFAKNSESCFIEAISTVELVNIEVQSLFLNPSRELGHQIHSEEIFDN